MDNSMKKKFNDLWAFGKPKWQTNSAHDAYDKEVGDEESQETLLAHNPNEERKTSFRQSILWGIWITLKTVFFFSYPLLVYQAWKYWDQDPSCRLGNERIFDDVPVFYESVRFERAGFHDSRHEELTKYEGAPNAQNNAAWERLLEVGVVGISEKENLRLTNGSASAPRNPDQYMVELELFHQLHCLKWLRDQIFEFHDAFDNSHALMNIPQRKDHNDHCIDYLRQAIMCHGDITPITFEWISEINGYIAHHSTEHQCRNFEAIYNWAKDRDTTGLQADGKHQNVEFNEQENFD
ncbi:hypothetical protein F4805DRAFT_354269 [Annulohypoxylon moriforme]|nr:hypothetical protein F4805DRAFT_354269 [Annulohypoxylon moriforme]